ncbi:molecular chaperone [Belliella baltica DSM 15883]|uniref:Molecular chaperone n=1 Tax=Belliella baltica (strain DSM 15883 / CIP 108006 / LMG 21964 / BA134) TaxID=866536 RepID=I3Z3I5_BELBD|nr:anhydro-N-acetylmuramic acid kinase [Belliella baltica]AFL83803.1 molecular chaperone [Belliella baltica DSM 15883]
MSQPYHMIGLMSGTSGDGLDIAYCQFTKSAQWTFKIVEAETVAFPSALENQLKNSHQLSGLELHLLDVAFGKWMGEESKKFVAKHQIQVEAIASHGHTVFHQPEKGLSLQIGNGWALHAASGLPVINDFRMLDVQLGGQGAPLVPIGDMLLFDVYDYCINLGGIANISLDAAGQRTAFDVCPFNLLLNHYAQQKGMPYDKGGVLASSGVLFPEILRELNEIPFYHKRGAKSLGREDLAVFYDILEKYPNVPIEDKLHTLIIHYVYQIKKVIPNATGKMLVTGGGAYNSYFMKELSKALGENLDIPKADPILIDFKEALIFAFLGVLRLRNENNCLASVTGASRDSCGGVIYGN